MLDLPEDRSRLLGVFYSTYWTGCADAADIFVPFVPQPVVVPDGIAFKKWQLTTEDDARFLEVAIDDSDIYVKGLSEYIPEGVIEGTLENGIAYFYKGQYMGVDPRFNTLNYFCPADIIIYNEGMETEMVKYEISDWAMLDYTGNAMTYDGAFIINAGPEILSANEVYKYPEMEVYPENISWVPAAPLLSYYYPDPEESFVWYAVIPKNVDGYVLETSDLYVRFFEDGDLISFGSDDETDVPYGEGVDDEFTGFYVFWKDGEVCYFCRNMEALTYGCQVVCKKDGKIYESEMLVIDAVTGEPITDSVDNLSSEADVVRIEWYDMLGRKVSAAYHGICMKKTIFSDGTIESVKIYRK